MNLRKQICKLGKTIEHDITHNLMIKDMGPERPYGYATPVIATLEYFGASKNQINQVHYDLVVAKYKIWHALSLWLDQGLAVPDESGDPDLTYVVEKFAKIYLVQKHVGGWARYLETHDIEFEGIKDIKHDEACIEDYNEIIEQQN